MFYRGHLKDTASGRWPVARDLGYATTLFDPVRDRDIPVTVELGDTEMAILDTDHNSLARWPYAEIDRAFGPAQRLDYVFMLRGHPSEQFTVGNADLYRLLMKRAPQLRRGKPLIDRAGSIFLKTIVGIAVAFTAFSAIVWIIRTTVGR